MRYVSIDIQENIDLQPNKPPFLNAMAYPLSLPASWRRPETLGVLIAFMSALAYGSWSVAGKTVYHLGGDPVLVAITVTWGRALVLTLVSLKFGNIPFARKTGFKDALIGGVCQAVSAIGFLSAMEYLPVPVVSIILQSYTLGILGFMLWRKEMPITALPILTTFVILGGLSLVLDLWHPMKSMSLIGVGLALLAMVTTAARIYVYGRLTQDRHPILVGAENFLIGGVLMSVYGFFVPPHLPTDPAAFLWLGLAVGLLSVASIGMFLCLPLIGSFRYSLIGKMETVVTTILAALFLGEILSPSQYIGILIVILGLVTYQIVSYQQRKRA